jgi:flagellar hook-associated protein 2
MTTTTSSTTGTTTTTYDSASIGSALLTALGGGTGINMTSMATAIAKAQYMTQTSTVEPSFPTWRSRSRRPPR